MTMPPLQKGRAKKLLPRSRLIIVLGLVLNVKHTWLHFPVLQKDYECKKY